MASPGYERRNRLAREQGFSGYSEKRRALEYANHSPEFVRVIGDTAGGKDARNLDMAKLYYQAFREEQTGSYKLRTRGGQLVVKKEGGKIVGARAKWIVDVARYVDDAEEWKRRYPGGRRE